MPTPDPRLPGVLPGLSVREAAQRLGVSESDLRRRVKRGEIDAGYYDRPGGTILRVFLPAPEDAPAVTAFSEAEATPEPRQGVSEAIQAALAPMVEMLTGERAERQRATVENADLRERIGRADALADSRAEALIWTDERRVLAEASAEHWRAVAEALGARADQVEQERRDLAAELERARRPWWRKLTGR